LQQTYRAAEQGVWDDEEEIYDESTHTSHYKALDLDPGRNFVRAQRILLKFRSARRTKKSGEGNILL
jgi:hypothetical protein